MRTTFVSGLVSLTLGLLLGAGCSGSSADNGFGDGGGGGGGGDGAGGGGDGFGSFGDGGGGGSDGNSCVPSPGNYDIPGNGCDDDGDGKIDNVTICDQGLAAAGAASDFVKALGLCQTASGPSDTKWGVISATFTKGYNGGTPNDASHGILGKFGAVITPREGSSLGVLSSGYGLEYDDPTQTNCGPNGNGPPCFKGNQTPMSGPGVAPPGYPKAANGCPGANAVLDAIGIKLQVKVPNNAQGIQFDFDFYSGEWPEYVCTAFNDSFVVWYQSTAFPGKAGDLNISFDKNGNPVSVNNGFFDRCTMNTQTGCMGGGGGTAACPGGPAELGGTGFDNQGMYCPGGMSTGGGATGWLTTKAPAKQGEVITIQFIIWDTGDANWDSSVLVDNFVWQPGPTMNGTVRPQ